MSDLGMKSGPDLQQKIRHFIDLWEIPAGDLRLILDEALSRKQARNADMTRGQTDADTPLHGHILAMLFEKPSTRTRISFQLAIRQLGGEALAFNASDIQLGRGEAIEDTAKIISSLADMAMIRANRQQDMDDFAGAASIPVINGLTNRAHPCQIMACMMTLEEKGLDLQQARLAWVGDGNNVCASFAHGAGKFGYELAIATPKAYALPPEDVSPTRAGSGRISFHASAAEAVAGADVVITDTFVSMGDEDASARLAALAPFQVNAALMALASPGALFSHCLPAHRGEEVTAEVIDGPASIVFAEAENRLHVQKAILLWCMDKI